MNLIDTSKTSHILFLTESKCGAGILKLQVLLLHKKCTGLLVSWHGATFTAEVTAIRSERGEGCMYTVPGTIWGGQAGAELT